MVAEQGHVLRDFDIVGRDRATVPAGAEVLAGIKAKRGRIAERPRRPPTVGAALCLGGIFEYARKTGMMGKAA